MTTKWLTEQNLSVGNISNKFDTIIIGGGPVGLLTALTLAASKKNHIAVIEEKVPLLHTQEIFPATLSLSKKKPDSHFELQLAGLETLKRMILEQPKIACNALMDGFFHIATTRDEMSFFEKLATEHKDFTLLMADDARDFFKLDTNIMGGLYCGREFIFNINMFYDRIHKLLVKSGHYVLQHHGVVDVQNTSSKIVVILDNKHAIECQHLVYCTGNLPKWLPKNKNINLKKIYNLNVSLAEPFQFVPHIFNNENTLLFNYDESINCTQLLKETIWPSPLALDTTYVGNLFKNLFSKFDRGGQLTLNNVWANTYYATPDNTPIISSIPSRPNEFLNIAFGSNGISWAAISSALISDFIFKTDTFGNEAKHFSLSRF